MSILIDRNKCVRCGDCLEVCPGNLIKRGKKGTPEEGVAYLRHPEECWGCASCLKECRHGAIFYYLGADIGGRGSLMQTEFEGDLCHWKIYRDGQEPIVITVDRRNANQY